MTKPHLTPRSDNIMEFVRKLRGDGTEDYYAHRDAIQFAIESLEMEIIEQAPRVETRADVVEAARAENDKVDDLLTAIEYAEQDVGHRPIADIIKELGPVYDTLKAALDGVSALVVPHALVGYIDSLFVSGNEVPVTKPWLSAETWAVVKDYLRHGLPLDHDRIEIERIYRQKTAVGLRAYSPLAAALAESEEDRK